MAYATTGVASSFAYLTLRSRLAVWASLAAASVLFEILQSRIPGRFPALRDALASSAGLTLGLLAGASLAALMGLFSKRRSAGKRAQDESLQARQARCHAQQSAIAEGPAERSASGAPE